MTYSIKRAGKTKSDITQLLRGTRNLTLHTFADLAFALGYRVEFKACPSRQLRVERSEPATEGKTYYMYRFADRRSLRTVYQKTATTPAVKVAPQNLGA